MSKFKFRFKLTGLEIEVEGDREHAPQIAENIGRQLSSFMQPAGLIEVPQEPPSSPVIDGNDVVRASRGPRRRRSSRSSASANGAAGESIPSWGHDPTKWGTPRQDWKSTQKIAWMLAVIEKANGQRAELTGAQIANAFNNKFKSAGVLRRGNVARDLGNSSEMFGEMEGRWFLKEKGDQAAEKLIIEARGQSPEGA